MISLSNGNRITENLIQRINKKYGQEIVGIERSVIGDDYIRINVFAEKIPSKKSRTQFYHTFIGFRGFSTAFQGRNETDSVEIDTRILQYRIGISYKESPIKTRGDEGKISGFEKAQNQESHPAYKGDSRKKFLPQKRVSAYKKGKNA